MVEYNNKYDDEIREIVETHPFNYAKILKSTGYKDKSLDRTYLMNYIYECTPLLNDTIHTLKTRIYWVLNKLSDFPTCRNTIHGEHKLVNANVKNLKNGYPAYCCSKCQHESPEYHSKIKQALLDKYGVDNAFKIESVKQDLHSRQQEIQHKRDITHSLHYGDIPGWNLVKSIETRKQLYGSAWNTSKIAQTKQNRYGNKTFNNSAKAFVTKRYNGTLNSSIPEQLVVSVVKYCCPNAITQYKSEKYPFSCDVYDPVSDTYFEYNGSWTHGGHPFDKNSCEDLKTLESWKAKHTQYYDNAAHTWAIRDPHKREVAKANGVKLVEFWNFNDVETYFGVDFKISDLSDKTTDTYVKVIQQPRQHTAEKSYRTFGESSFKKFQTYSFPYPTISQKSICHELETLQSSQTADYTPSKLIRSTHLSMYKCRRGKISPYEYWNKLKDQKSFQDGTWEKYYLNRFIYAESTKANEFRSTGMLDPKTILDGFTTTKIAPCVGYLKPMLAKRLVHEYLDDCSEVFCPFNGFSGIMLGTALGCRKNYIGQDINEQQIAESQQIVEIAKSNGYEINVDLSAKDVFSSSGTYESLICCPPYQDIEQWNFDNAGNCTDKNLTCDGWIDVCLSNFNCRKYVFIVDDKSTKKYKDYVVEQLTNRSHFGVNHEFVVVIKK